MIKRPFDFRQDIADEICKDLIGGKSLRTICKSESMPSQNRVYQWLSENEEFRKQYAHARELQADAIFDECLDIADDASNDFKVNGEGEVAIDHDAVNRARLKIDTRKWMAGKLRPKKYGDKLVAEHSGPDGGPIEVAETHNISSSLAKALQALKSAKGE